ncbi:MAG: hypothetical protein EOO01_38295 [Chitinophagaceae bacterium]|nr:MAG: hypothetical protein EOO01_38295 [Chitinophagaceae bacterium]
MKTKYSEAELNAQSALIRSRLLWIFIPTAIMVAGFMYYQNNSVQYNLKKYKEFQATSFSGKVTGKRKDGDCTRCERYITLDNYREELIDFDIYSKIKIGDFVQKFRGHDSVLYYLSNGEVVITDKGKFIRERYKKASQQE